MNFKENIEILADKGLIWKNKNKLSAFVKYPEIDISFKEIIEEYQRNRAKIRMDKEKCVILCCKLSSALGQLLYETVLQYFDIGMKIIDEDTDFKTMKNLMKRHLNHKF